MNETHNVEFAIGLLLQPDESWVRIDFGEEDSDFGFGVRTRIVIAIDESLILGAQRLVVWEVVVAASFTAVSSLTTAHADHDHARCIAENAMWTKGKSKDPGMVSVAPFWNTIGRDRGGEGGRRTHIVSV